MGVVVGDVIIGSEMVAWRDDVSRTRLKDGDGWWGGQTPPPGDLSLKYGYPIPEFQGLIV